MHVIHSDTQSYRSSPVHTLCAKIIASCLITSLLLLKMRVTSPVLSLPPSLPPQPSGKHVVYIRDRQEGEGDESGNEKPAPPKEFLLLALVGILCCPLFGVIALLKALAVSGMISGITEKC